MIKTRNKHIIYLFNLYLIYSKHLPWITGQFYKFVKCKIPAKFLSLKISYSSVNLKLLRSVKFNPQTTLYIGRLTLCLVIPRKEANSTCRSPKENIRLMGFCHLKRLLCVKAAQEPGIHSVSCGEKDDFQGKDTNN